MPDPSDDEIRKLCDRLRKLRAKVKITHLVSDDFTGMSTQAESDYVLRAANETPALLAIIDQLLRQRDAANTLCADAAKRLGEVKEQLRAAEASAEFNHKEWIIAGAQEQQLRDAIKASGLTTQYIDQKLVVFPRGDDILLDALAKVEAARDAALAEVSRLARELGEREGAAKAREWTGEGWVRTADRVPEDEGRVLVCAPGNEMFGAFIDVGRWSGMFWWSSDWNQDFGRDHFAYWQPLPQPPADEGRRA